MSFQKISTFKYFLCFVTVLVIGSSCTNKTESIYTIETRVNPYKIAPLTALLQIQSKKPCSATVKILGETPIERSFNKSSTNLNIPVVGLYPNTMNRVVVKLQFENEEIIDTLKIETTTLPVNFPSIEINKIERELMEPGFHACDIHYANYGKFRSIPMIFDDQGIVRWYLDLSFNGKMTSPFQRLKDGTILVVDRHSIFEFDMLGRQLKKTEIDKNYGMHHDLIELPNGNLLICVGKRDAFIDLNGKNIQSDSDYVILYDRNESKIIKEWDLAKHLDVSRNDINFLREGDWLHMNALVFDEKDSSIIVSGKNQGLVKISWDDKLKWILAPKKNWGKSGRNGEGFETNPYLLTALNLNGKPYDINIQNGDKSSDEFDFSWGQHAPEILPNGNILLFDNGSYRNFNNENNYSRAVEYQLDEKNRTVKQVWQYGKDRGDAFYSSIVSDIDYLASSNNILITSGFISPNSNNSAKIVEVNPVTGKEVFEATLKLKTLAGEKTVSWGQFDILYRSERMELKY